jgi:hypothetical protein
MLDAFLARAPCIPPLVRVSTLPVPIFHSPIQSTQDHSCSYTKTSLREMKITTGFWRGLEVSYTGVGVR